MAEPPSRPADHHHGYTLAGFMIVLVLLELAVAAALPLWSASAKRDEEEEMVFRGLQYAEAIRLFQSYHGRLPVSFKEVVENKNPRILRQAWTNPKDVDSGWLPILQLEGTNAGGKLDPNGDLVPGQEKGISDQRPDPQQQLNSRESNSSGRSAGDRRRRFGEQEDDEAEPPAPFLGGSLEDVEDNQYGPFSGLKPGLSGESMMVYMGSEDYEDWEFVPDHLIQPPKPDGSLPTPRLWTQRFWVPVPGLEPEGGGGPSSLDD